MKSCEGQQKSARINAPANTEAHDHFLRIAVRTLRDAEFWLYEWHKASVHTLILVKKETHWLLVCKVDFNGKPLVSYTTGDSIGHTIINFGYALAQKGLKWKEDERVT